MSTTTQDRAVPQARKTGSPRSLARQQVVSNWMLLTPGVIWMVLCLVLPMLMMIYVSFWTQTTFSINSNLTLDNWAAFFSTPTYLNSLLTTLRLWLITLALIFAIGYPSLSISACSCATRPCRPRCSFSASCRSGPRSSSAFSPGGRCSGRTAR